MRRSGGEILVSVAVLGGWGLFTWGVARLWVWEAWLLSAGLLLFSLAGWRWLFGRVFWHGLWGLHVMRREDDE